MAESEIEHQQEKARNLRSEIELERRREKARNLRYKKSCLATMGADDILSELNEMCEACSDIVYIVEDQETLDALIGDEDEAFEFRMLFSELSAGADQLYNCILDNYGYYGEGQQEFDDCTVGLIGNRYEVLGFDGYEEDYMSMTSYEQDLAQTEAGKRLMRHTKAEMLSIIGQAMGTLMAFYDLRQRYYSMKASIDILRGNNSALLKQVKEIEEAYEKAEEVGFGSWNQETKHFDRLCTLMPERAWVE